MGHLIINDTLKQQTTARKFTRHNLFDTNRHTQVKRCGCFFHKRKNWLHKNVLCWRKYKLIFAALYILQIKISERKLPLIRSKMFIPFDHKQYVWVDKRQLWSKVFRHNFFHKKQYLKYQAFSKARDIKFRKTLKCFPESGIETDNFTIRVLHLSLCQNDAQMTHMA